MQDSPPSMPTPEEVVDWTERYAPWLGAVVLLSLLTFAGSLVLLPLLLSRLPADYFATRDAPPSRWRSYHPYVRVLVLVAKNAVGAVLLVAGIAMLVLPGQGLLTIFAALVLLNFPGKRALEISLLRRPRIKRAIDWIRARAYHPPMDPPFDPRRGDRARGPDPKRRESHGVEPDRGATRDG